MINIKFPHLTNKDGFTLIELVVAFSIMAVLSTIGVVSFVNYSRTQTLQQAVNDLATALGTAKSMSVAQITTPNVGGGDLKCFSGQSFGGYGITTTTGTNPNSYTLYIKCSGVEVPASTSTPLPKNISFGSSTTTDVFFPILIGGVVGNGGIVLNNSFGLPSKTVNIDSGGNIRVASEIFCANENGQCNFSGTKIVQYGANGSYYYKTLTDGTPCTNAIFGDPLVGTVKKCYYQDSNP